MTMDLSGLPQHTDEALVSSEEAAEEWDAGQQYALVELSGTSLAVETSRASQILVRLPITPVPNTPEFVLGVCNVRGDIYSVVDMRPLLGFPAVDQVARPDPLIILLEGQRCACGATIEGVSELLRIPDGQIVAPASDIPFVAGLYRRGQDTVLVLDVEALLQSPEMSQFQ